MPILSWHKYSIAGSHPEAFRTLSMIISRRLWLLPGDAGSWGGLEGAEEQLSPGKAAPQQKMARSRAIGAHPGALGGPGKARKLHTLGEQVCQGPQNTESSC